MSITGQRFVVRDAQSGSDLEFNVVVAGKGDPVLLLHGFPDSSQVWSAQIQSLSDAGYQVIAPDLRGFGDSAKPHDPDPARDVGLYSLLRIVGDVVGIVTQLQLTKPVHVVGHDWGAVLGWVLASV